MSHSKSLRMSLLVCCYCIIADCDQNQAAATENANDMPQAAATSLPSDNEPNLTEPERQELACAAWFQRAAQGSTKLAQESGVTNNIIGAEYQFRADYYLTDLAVRYPDDPIRTLLSKNMDALPDWSSDTWKTLSGGCMDAQNADPVFKQKHHDWARASGYSL